VAAAFRVVCGCEQRRLVVGLKYHARELLPRLVANAAVAAAAGAAEHLLHSARLLTHLPPAAEVHPHVPVQPYPYRRSQLI
jgi:hypothetical protein